MFSVMAANNSSHIKCSSKLQDGGSQYNDPAYKKLSRINGDINKMTKDQMKERCANLHLDTRYFALLLPFVLQLII